MAQSMSIVLKFKFTGNISEVVLRGHDWKLEISCYYTTC